VELLGQGQERGRILPDDPNNLGGDFPWIPGSYGWVNQVGSVLIIYILYIYIFIPKLAQIGFGFLGCSHILGGPEQCV
jgi:hypothetical protein